MDVCRTRPHGRSRTRPKTKRRGMPIAQRAKNSSAISQHRFTRSGRLQHASSSTLTQASQTRAQPDAATTQWPQRVGPTAPRYTRTQPRAWCSYSSMSSTHPAQKELGLPLLPGMSFGNPLKTDHRKAHAFGEARPKADKPPPGSTLLYPKGAEGEVSVPAWQAFDKKVLRFNAYFKEPVFESPAEQFRVRRVVLFFFLEDDTMRVDEPKQENSGLPQGQLLRRHRIPKPKAPPGTFYSVQDLNVGVEIDLYGRVFDIYSCDEFTRKFLGKVGIDVPPNEDGPKDEYLEKRAAAWWGGRIQGKGKAADKPQDLKRFLAQDGKVLRFNAVWDDRAAVYGDRRLFLIHYFLADDTVEIKEVIPPNAGRDPVAQFMKRGKLPKRMAANTFINDHLTDDPKSFYSLKDLRIGAVLSVYGRTFLLYDCDPFTKQYLHDRYGITDFTPLDISEPTAELPRAKPPPPTGFGSDEDSLGSWHTLVPKPPRKDFAKMKREEGKALRFAALLDTDNPIDRDRRFVVTYQLALDLIQVHEQPKRNSGIAGGRFLGPGQGTKLKLPDGSRYYQPEDFYVGARVILNKYPFILIDADEYALNYMEGHDDRFAVASVPRILDSLKADMAAAGHTPEAVFAHYDTDGSGALEASEFRKMLREAGYRLTEHEILTLLRRFDLDNSGTVSLEEFGSALA